MPERIVHDADGCSVVIATTNTGAAEVYAGCFWQGVSKGAEVREGRLRRWQHTAAASTAANAVTTDDTTTFTAATNTGAAEV